MGREVVEDNGHFGFSSGSSEGFPVLYKHFSGTKMHLD